MKYMTCKVRGLPVMLAGASKNFWLMHVSFISAPSSQWCDCTNNKFCFTEGQLELHVVPDEGGPLPRRHRICIRAIIILTVWLMGVHALVWLLNRS